MTTVQFPRQPDDALYEYLAEKARVCGGGADEIWEGLCSRFALPVAGNDGLKAAQYQGEPVAWKTGSITWGYEPDARRHGEQHGVPVVPLYAEQPAPVAQKYDDTLLPFLALMRNELHANAHKGDREGWLRMTLENALDEIRRHADKLIIPVMNHDRAAIREHAADVANCAMMLADIAVDLTRE